ncbi:GntR family transcriptional regulator [Actinomadura opuntiae]|uniref:GntR family transcriptional regulator n=1 Tax=Actinomadura sp. OS1-43 TaxID=604315 RepID=UPI00255AE3F8|nr:GntR family transcriptional regulator [Actinomadura sp. OS1-43]MDL4818485.1 GntR family transcriptional regulator [Actinomadura sp. OS1-43]
MSPADRSARKPATAKRDLVMRHLLDIIDDAGPGTGLPSERQLAADLGVSRPTVRAAIEELTRTGLLTRHYGRGTFTSPHKVTQELAANATNALGVPPAEGKWTSHVVEFTTAPAGPTRATRLHVAADAPILRIVRVRFVDDEPIAIEHLQLPADLLPGLQPHDMEAGNFYHLLRDRYGILVTDAIQTIEPTVTNPDQADLLDVPVYTPALSIERTTKDATGRIVEHVRSIYRGDRYRITSKLRFDATSG